jgi:hypothetical protein
MRYKPSLLGLTTGNADFVNASDVNTEIVTVLDLPYMTPSPSWHPDILRFFNASTMTTHDNAGGLDFAAAVEALKNRRISGCQLGLGVM